MCRFSRFIPQIWNSMEKPVARTTETASRMPATDHMYEYRRKA